MINCDKTDTSSLKPPDLREPCKLTPDHGGLCSWHPAFGRAEQPVVCEVRVNGTHVGDTRYDGCDVATAIQRAVADLKSADRNASTLSIVATRVRIDA